MKTIEKVNGQKVWAVDATHGCDGCMFKDIPITNTCFQRCDDERPDKRNVIFLPYEEKKEKIFTLSQINVVINELIKSESYTHSISLNKLKQKLEQL